MSDLPRLSLGSTHPDSCRGGAVSVGNFDGVHLGHAALVDILVREARQFGGPAVAVTFDPHPLALLAPERFQPVLTDLQTRTALLKQIGADAVVVLKTTPELLRLTADDFFHQVLRRQLDAQAIVEGFNFRFGRSRAGDLALLKQRCEQSGLRFHVAPAFELDGNPVSSSRVRDSILNGDMETATRLLGRPYSLRGRVADGARRGRMIGFPTANLSDVETLVPRDGVYATRASVDGESYASATNVGANPTFGETGRKIEVHLLDFSGDLYGRVLSIELVGRLRDTRPFTSIDELKTQLICDVANARRILR